MLTTLLALAAVVNADYIQTAQFGAAGCTGSPASRNAQQLGCTDAGAGRYRAISCTNSTWGVSNFYTTSTCTGDIAAVSVIGGFSWGCSSSGSQSTEGTCVTGAWAAPPASLAVISYPNSPACPQTTTADNAASYSTGSCLSFGPSSARASCSSSSYTFTTFTSTDCSGTASSATGSTGCAPATGGAQGVTVYQCTSGASSASIAFASIALMLVVAASTAAV